ncbi:MAG: TRAP transporter large permease [Alphaproteobacteria bacterium]|nr:TRAP transporter large permease [Alphaproteobacteria bacterium]
MTETILIVMAGWLAIMLLGVPIFASMGLAAAAFVWWGGFPGIVIPQKIAQAANSFPLLAAPFFILMGNLMNSAGITERIFAFAKVLVGWWRGGLCHANIIGSVIFAGMSGSAVADAAGLGTVEIKAMTDAGYDKETAAAVTAASATIGPIIPPSLPMVIYGVVAEASIGGLFIAAIIPGLMMAGAMMALVWHMARKRDMPRETFPSLCDVWVAFRDAFWAIMAPVLLIGGMLSGIFTPTEAAAVAAFYALILGLFIYRDFSIRELPRIILNTVETTGVVLAVVMCAVLFGWALSVSRLPQFVGGTIIGWSDNPLVILLIVNLLLLVVGCFMESIAAILILVPILVPVALQVGIDPIQFGVIFVLNLMIGTLTPPVGIVLFVISKVADLPLERVTRATAPFLVPLIAVLAAISLWPPLTTFLPGQVFGR